MSELIKISEQDGGWNSEGEPYVLVSEVTGELKTRVLRRFGLTSGTATLTEETLFGGYSEYTQENSTSFTVKVGNREIEFEADENEEFENHRGSVFARFHAWLRATEDPAALLKEWLVTEPDENRRLVVRKETMLYRCLRYARWTDEYYLRLPETIADNAELNGVRLCADGFRALEPLRGFTLHATSLVGDDAQKVACALTDYAMPRAR